MESTRIRSLVAGRGMKFMGHGKLRALRELCVRGNIVR